jgi:hypothetical protein
MNGDASFEVARRRGGALYSATLGLVLMGGAIWALGPAGFSTSAIALAPLAMFGVGTWRAWRGLHRWFDRRPGLRIDAHGLTDRSDGEPRHCAWGDIVGFEAAQLNDRQAIYVLHQRSARNRTLLGEALLPFGGAPSDFCIDADALDIEAGALLAILRRHHAQHRARP